MNKSESVSPDRFFSGVGRPPRFGLASAVGGDGANDRRQEKNFKLKITESKRSNKQPVDLVRQLDLAHRFNIPIHYFLFYHYGHFNFLSHRDPGPYKPPLTASSSQDFHSFRSSPSLSLSSRSLRSLLLTMRGFNPLIVLILSFVSFVASGRLHSNARSSRLPKGPVSSRQFHYPRALVDVCAHVDLSLLANVLGLLQASGLGQICLCLSAFPLDLTADARLGLLVKSLGQAKAQATLKDLVCPTVFLSPSTFSRCFLQVAGRGSHCAYPDHALPKCAPGNVCDFSCADGYTRNGASCLCSPPNSVCNGKCGTHPRVRTPLLFRCVPDADVSIGLYLGPSKGSQNGTKEHHIISQLGCFRFPLS